MQEAKLLMSNDASWKDVLSAERKKEYFVKILRFIEERRQVGAVVYPAKSKTFEALKITPFDKVRVVILGQDPYHGPGQAHGLCFSVPPKVALPPSLQNIFRELNSDLGIPIASSGSLHKWAQQGVLLLNTTLSVERGRAGSHSKIGWELFTDHIISSLSEKREGIVFLLWGSHARKKRELINPIKHHILEAPHPSPLSAHRGFLGCKHFSKTNEILRRQGNLPIDWNVE
jgi:uracil-DNA glycosylase